MDTEIKIVRAPGQRNWASALSRIPEPYRSAVAEGLSNETTDVQTPPCVPGHDAKGDLSTLEQRMLIGGRGLSLITYAGFVPYHLIDASQVEPACDMLRSGKVRELMRQMNGVIKTTHRLLLIGDDPSASLVGRSIELCRQEHTIGTLIAGPGNLMEHAVRAWALEAGWPNAYLRTLDGSGGDAWNARAGSAIDQAVTDLFDVHKPTLLALLEPVRLPATQSAIEQASSRKIRMITITAMPLNSAMRR